MHVQAEPRLGVRTIEQPAGIDVAAAYVEDVRRLVHPVHSGVPPCTALDVLPVISLASLARLLGLTPPVTVDPLALGGL